MIKECWERTMRLIELGTSALWLVSSLVLLITLLFGYGRGSTLIYLGFSLSGILQWMWRKSVWPTLRRQHNNL